MTSRAKTEGARAIVRQLRNLGFTAYFAGGWVRDYLLGHPSDDVDIATDAPPETILTLFSKTILVGLSFAVVIVEEGGHLYEVASFRKDIAYSDGRKPDQIELSSPEEDAFRRDFTINGLFYDPLEDKIYDYVGGIRDLEHKVIRAIGNPYDRFLEDRLRMIRAVRFSARFDFYIDKETEDAIIANADFLFPACAKERIYQELVKMAGSPHFDRALLDLHRLRLLQALSPKFEKMHHNELKEALLLLQNFPPHFPMIVSLRQIFRAWTLEEQLEFCLFLTASQKDVNIVRYLGEADEKLKSIKTLLPHEIARLLSSPYAHFLFLTHKEGPLLEKEYSRLKAHIERIETKRPLIRAEDLQKQGLSGKKLGEALKRFENESIDANIQTREEALKRFII